MSFPLLLTCTGIQCSNTAGPRHDPDTPGNHALVSFHRLPGEGHPRHCVALYGEVGVSPVTLCRLLLYGQRAEPSKGGQQNPRMLFP
jgi:hypothetical protein